MRHAERARAGPYTWDDFVALPEDDRRELIDGELVEVEVPIRIHEYIVMMLGYFLTGYARRHGGQVLASGYKVRIAERRGVMPDIQYYADGNDPGEAQEQGLVDGRPDLVVEVISKSSRRYDRVVKLAYYASREIPEYWIVEPKTRTLERFVYEEHGYELASKHEGDVHFAPSTMRGLKIPLAELWSPPSKKPKKKH